MVVQAESLLRPFDAAKPRYHSSLRLDRWYLVAVLFDQRGEARRLLIWDLRSMDSLALLQLSNQPLYRSPLLQSVSPHGDSILTRMNADLT